MDRLKHFYNFCFRGGSPALSVERKTEPCRLPGCRYRRPPILILWCSCRRPTWGLGREGSRVTSEGSGLAPVRRAARSSWNRQTLGPVTLPRSLPPSPVLRLCSHSPSSLCSWSGGRDVLSVSPQVFPITCVCLGIRPLQPVHRRKTGLWIPGLLIKKLKYRCSRFRICLPRFTSEFGKLGGGRSHSQMRRVGYSVRSCDLCSFG